MKQITINGKDYKLEFSFEAAEYHEIVQRMFNLVSMAPVLKRTASIETDDDAAVAMVDGSAEMVGMIPETVKEAFYAGLLENHEGITKQEAKELMKSYMKEHKLSFAKLFEEIRQCMEDDDFFDLSGINDMMEKIGAAAEEKTEKVTKMPTKKSTSTKSSKN